MINEAKRFDGLIENISEDLYILLKKIPTSYKEKIEEIRLRNGLPLALSHDGMDSYIDKNGNITLDLSNAILVNEEHIKSTFQIISNYSIYAYLEEIKQGYITIKGGHRVGIGGKVVYGLNGIENIKNISSLNLRIGRQKLGISNDIIPYLLKDSRYFFNTLIISPPQCGKTTLLRDIIRNLSNGYKSTYQGFKVTIVDERSELAGLYNGQAQNDVGIRTDILDGCLKSDGIIMAIRSLSPQIIAVDEIGSKRDVEAINEALKAGIKLIATVHGSSLDEILEKSSMEDLFKNKTFERYIILDRSKGVGTIKEIIEGYNFKSIS